jgi:hypothetical protein
VPQAAAVRMVHVEAQGQGQFPRSLYTTISTLISICDLKSAIKSLFSGYIFAFVKVKPASKCMYENGIAVSQSIVLTLR